MNKIGIKIRRIRESKSFSQDYMANRLNISQNVYSKLESGGVKLTTERLKQIAEILEIPEETLYKEDFNIFNVHNSTIDKFYIETLKEENKDLLKKLTDQIDYLQEENKRLTKIIESLSEKIK